MSAYLSGKDRSERVESERWKSFAYDELVARDKANLDITWLRDESLEDADDLPAPEVIAREIVEDLTRWSGTIMPRCSSNSRPSPRRSKPLPADS